MGTDDNETTHRLNPQIGCQYLVLQVLKTEDIRTLALEHWKRGEVMGFTKY